MSDQSAAAAIGHGQDVEWGMTRNAAAAAGHIQLISFAIGDDQYGVDIMSVHEIKSWSEIHHLPRQPDYVRGVLNLRGVMIPIIDLRCRFGGGLTETTPLHVVIVVQIQSQMIGLIADRVSDIVSIDPAKVQPVPQVSDQLRGGFLSGLVTIGEQMIALIDLDRLFVSNGAGDDVPSWQSSSINISSATSSEFQPS